MLESLTLVMDLGRSRQFLRILQSFRRDAARATTAREPSDAPKAVLTKEGAQGFGLAHVPAQPLVPGAAAALVVPGKREGGRAPGVRGRVSRRRGRAELAREVSRAPLSDAIGGSGHGD